MAEKQTKTKQQTEEPKQPESTKPVSRPKVLAGKCPRSPNHRNTQVYNTKGRVRNCKCNDCGHTWQKTGAYADDLREFCAQVAESLDKAGRVEHGGESVIVMQDKDAREIASTLRELISN